MTMKASDSDSDSDSEPEDEDNEDYFVILTQTVNQSVDLHFALSCCFPFPLFHQLVNCGVRPSARPPVCLIASE